MKTVVSKSQVAHLWANKVQEHAKVSGGNFYFHGDTIYSYGSHFPIAKHVTNKKGKRAVIFTTRSYSNTTAKHISATRGAISHMDKIYVYNPEASTEKNIYEAIQSIKAELTGLRNARKPEKYINPAESVYSDLKKYCEFYSIKIPKEATKLIEEAKSGKYAEYLVKEAKRIERANKQREARELKREKERLTKWRNFDGVDINLNNLIIEGDFLRYNRNSKRVETSKGIEVPVEIAKKSHQWIKKTVKAGGCVGDCKYKILDFTVNTVSNDLIKIGCHTITMQEIEALASSLNW
jgi:hypothetical protein